MLRHGVKLVILYEYFVVGVLAAISFISLLVTLIGIEIYLFSEALWRVRYALVLSGFDGGRALIMAGCCWFSYVACTSLLQKLYLSTVKADVLWRIKLSS